MITAVGTAGLAGTGITVATPLTFAHANGASARDSGSGITVAPALASAHLINTQIRTVTPVGATNVKVGSVTGFAVGDTMAIGSFGFQESVGITAIGTTGSRRHGHHLRPGPRHGRTGTAKSLPISTTGTGVTLSAALAAAHPAGAPVTVYGAGSAPVALTNDMPAQPAYTAVQWKTRSTTPCTG